MGRRRGRAALSPGQGGHGFRRTRRHPEYGLEPRGEPSPVYRSSTWSASSLASTQNRVCSTHIKLTLYVSPSGISEILSHEGMAYLNHEAAGAFTFRAIVR